MSIWGGNNDPYEPHPASTNFAGRRANPEAIPMVNLAADPYMVNNLEAKVPTIEVKIIQAKGLPPARSNNTSTMCTVRKVSNANSKRPLENELVRRPDPINPIWNQDVGRLPHWVPGDTLHFEITRKDNSGVFSSFSHSSEFVAQARLEYGKYEGGYPSGWANDGWIREVTNQSGVIIPGAALQVQIRVHGVSQSWASRMARMCCGGMGLRQLLDSIKHLPQTIIKEFWILIGDPDPERNKADMMMLIAAPLLLFLLITWLGWLLLHFNSMAQKFIVGIAVTVCAILILASITVQKKSKKPLFALGALMILAIIFACLVCASGWHNSWEQWWWIHTGRKLGATAGTPANARSDSAIINFATMKNGTAWTSVDSTRAAGFRRGAIYCAAPILDPTVALGDIIRVEFWAIGINCCDDFGSFTCDSAREFRGGGSGVVMRGHGMPCNGCDAELFRLATLKAAGVNNMVSAPGALYVRYVTSPSTVENEYLAKCVFSFFWSFFFGVLLFGFLGFITNYKNWGKPGRFPLYHLIDDPHKPIHKAPVPLPHEKKQEAQEPPEKQWNLTLLRPEGPNGQPGARIVAMATEPKEPNYGGTIS